MLIGLLSVNLACPHARFRGSRGAFAAVELLCAVLVVGVLLCLLTVASSRSRAHAQLGESIANLKTLSDTFASFGLDNQDRILGYSWRAGTTTSQFGDLKTAATNLDGAVCQATDIARRRTGNSSIPRLTAWIPHVQTWNFVAAEYLNLPLPSKVFLSPGDEYRNALAANPSNWAGDNTTFRAALSTSYDVTAAAWGGPASGPDAVSQDGLPFNNFMSFSNSLATTLTLGSVAYPAQKALMFDRAQWYFGPRQGFFMYEEARIPTAAFDGSVQVRNAGKCNPGWRPNQPTFMNPTFVQYNATAASGMPPPLSGAPSDTVKGRLRFTRGGLAGRDFDGPEVP